MQHRTQRATTLFRYRDRSEAGKALATWMVERGYDCTTVLGLARGGVPVAYEIALAFKVPLDVLVVRKLRAPFDQELGIGAICSDGTKLVNQDLVQELRVSQGYLDGEVRGQLLDAKSMELALRSGYPPLNVAGQSVMLVDDGIATGVTMEAAVMSARANGARRVVVAAPVCSRSAADRLRRLADDVFFLMTPPDFRAVGQFYERFPPVVAEEIQRLLREGRRGRPEPQGT